MSASTDLDKVIPEDAVLATSIEYLDQANWTLEFDGLGSLEVPKSPPPVVATRAFVKAHVNDIFLSDHFEAVVYLEPERIGQNVVPKSGALKLYFDLDGRFVSEDRFQPVGRAQLTKRN